MSLQKSELSFELMPFFTKMEQNMIRAKKEKDKGVREGTGDKWFLGRCQESTISQTVTFAIWKRTSRKEGLGHSWKK